MFTLTEKQKDHDMTHREIELYQHMARGRKLRSEAFVAALAWIVRSVKSLGDHAPGAKTREAC